MSVRHSLSNIVSNHVSRAPLLLQSYNLPTIPSPCPPPPTLPHSAVTQSQFCEAPPRASCRYFHLEIQAMKTTDPSNDTHVSNHHNDILRHQSTSLQKVCAEVHARILAFLEEKPEVALLQRVQEQTRKSLQVTTEALSRYRYFP